MIYSINDEFDTTMRKNKIKDVKNKNAELTTYFSKCIKLYGAIFIIGFFILTLFLKKAVVTYILIFILYFLAVFILYSFQSYKIEYDNIQKQLYIKRWWHIISIPKDKLQKVYVKWKRRCGVNLYIEYEDDTNKEKCILLGIEFLKHNEIKDFLDIFIV